MNHCMAVRLPTMRILAPRPFHRPGMLKRKSMTSMHQGDDNRATHFRLVNDRVCPTLYWHSTPGIGRNQLPLLNASCFNQPKEGPTLPRMETALLFGLVPHDTNWKLSCQLTISHTVLALFPRLYEKRPGNFCEFNC